MPKKRVRKRKKKGPCSLCGPAHSLFAHFPKLKGCPICDEAKTQRARCPIKTFAEADDLPPPEAFANALAADHAIVNEEDQSRNHDRVSPVIQDKFSNWLQAFAAKSKNHTETKKSFQRFLPPGVMPKHVYTDKAPEYKPAFDELGHPSDTATPHRPETNGVAERAVRRVKECTSCARIQSG